MFSLIKNTKDKFLRKKKFMPRVMAINLKFLFLAFIQQITGKCIVPCVAFNQLCFVI